MLKLFKIRTHTIMSISSLCASSLQLSTKVDFKQEPVSISRVLIKVPRNTGVVEFDKNIRAKDKDNGRYLEHLPSWLENCRVVEQTEVDSLYKAFPSVVKDVVQMDCTKDLEIANKQLRRLMEHIVPWMPLMAVQLVVADRFYLERRKKNNQKMPNRDEHQRLVHKLAWGIEMINRKSFIIDDVMDQSETRNGIKCWHTFPDVGIRATNDACALLNAGHLLLNKYFSQMDYYANLLQWTHEIIYLFEAGEMEISNMKAVPKHELSQELYTATVEKRVRVKSILNGGIFINLAVISAMIMHEITDPGLKSEAIKIGNEVMNYGIMVDDCQDCFGDIRVTERETTDIQEGRQSWVLWKAMELGNRDQCQRLMECYGKKDKNCIEEVLKIFQQLNVHEAVNKLAEETYFKVEEKIEMLPQEDLPCSIWLNMLNHYKDVSRGMASRP